MKNLFKKDPSFEDTEIKEIERIMSITDRTDPNYETLLKRRNELIAAKQRDSFKPSADTIVIVVSNLVLAVMIMNFEKTDVLTSKAFTLFKRT